MSVQVDPLPAEAADGKVLGAESRKFRVPLVTLALLAVLTVVYIAELRSVGAVKQGGMPMNGSLLIVAGGVNRPMVLDHGQWFRLVTATVLHGNFLHIFVNGIVLLFGGALLENKIGGAWFLALYVLSGLGGSCLSLASHGPDINSVGASGAIMGVLAGAFVVTFRKSDQNGGWRARLGLLRLLIPAFFPRGPYVDVAAHFGGALAGGILASVLLIIWDAGAPTPKFQRLAWAVPIAALLILPIGARSGAATYDLLRGMAAEAAGQWADAEDAFSGAVRFDPAIEDTYGERGVVRFYQKRFREAAADFRTLADRRPGWGYAPLLMRVAEAHVDIGDRAEFARYAAAVDLAVWPGPALALFLGRMAPEAVQRAAAAAERAKNEHQTCEASFYIGEWARARGELDQGMSLIEKAQTCPADFFEHKLAMAELGKVK